MTLSEEYKIVTAKDDRDLVSRATEGIDNEWPEFMLHDPVADYLSDCYEKLPDYQFVLIETGREKPLALGNSIPLAWNGELSSLPDDGWDWALLKGMEDLRNGRKPSILCALQVVVFGNNRGKGISSQAVHAMKQIGRSAGLKGMIAPVRPNQKSNYPLTPIEKYITWTDENGRPFDPWLRVHYKLGAQIVKPCRSAMRISGTVAEWESWTEMSFPDSGQYIVSGALVPVAIDKQSDKGSYIEPHVWMYHPPE